MQDNKTCTIQLQQTHTFIAVICCLFKIDMTTIIAGIRILRKTGNSGIGLHLNIHVDVLKLSNKLAT